MKKVFNEVTLKGMVVSNEFIITNSGGINYYLARVKFAKEEGYEVYVLFDDETKGIDKSLFRKGNFILIKGGLEILEIDETINTFEKQEKISDVIMAINSKLVVYISSVTKSRKNAFQSIVNIEVSNIKVKEPSNNKEKEDFIIYFGKKPKYFKLFDAVSCGKVAMNLKEYIAFKNKKHKVDIFGKLVPVSDEKIGIMINGYKVKL